MKTIVCYGDSNTWGADPAGGPRFGLNERWPGIMRNELGQDYWVIEEGLCGRTTVWDDPIEGYKSGKEYLVPCLESHNPVDLVIIMLGTNDLKKRFSLSTEDIAAGAGVLVNMTQKIGNFPGYPVPQVLLLAPAPITETGKFAEMFEGGAAKSVRFGEYYSHIADTYGCHFLDAGAIVKSSALDGIHFEKGEHDKLGHAIANKVREIFDKK